MYCVCIFMINVVSTKYYINEIYQIIILINLHDIVIIFYIICNI